MTKLMISISLVLAMSSKLILGAIVLFAFGACFIGKRELGARDQPTVGPGAAPARIVSLAPSITETLYALGLGDRVVGITRFCEYPPETRGKARIGGFLDPNFEAIVALRPEIIVILEESAPLVPIFGKLGIASLVVCHKDVDGILASIGEIGRACGAQQRAEEIVGNLQSRLDRVQRKTKGLPRPRVLVAMDRTLGTGNLENVYVAGANGFFARVIPLAGGENACQQQMADFPTVSPEGILHMNPQVIFDLIAPVVALQFDRRTILADWQAVGSVEAVVRGRVSIVDQDYALVPGPRFILLVEEFARLMHPEVDWDKQ